MKLSLSSPVESPPRYRRSTQSLHIQSPSDNERKECEGEDIEPVSVDIVSTGRNLTDVIVRQPDRRPTRMDILYHVAFVLRPIFRFYPCVLQFLHERRCGF